jgi:hypothetical protein
MDNEKITKTVTMLGEWAKQYSILNSCGNNYFHQIDQHQKSHYFSFDAKTGELHLDYVELCNGIFQKEPNSMLTLFIDTYNIKKIVARGGSFHKTPHHSKSAGDRIHSKVNDVLKIYNGKNPKEASRRKEVAKEISQLTLLTFNDMHAKHIDINLMDLVNNILHKSPKQRTIMIVFKDIHAKFIYPGKSMSDDDEQKETVERIQKKQHMSQKILHTVNYVVDPSFKMPSKNLLDGLWKQYGNHVEVVMTFRKLIPDSVNGNIPTDVNHVPKITSSISSKISEGFGKVTTGHSNFNKLVLITLIIVLMYHLYINYTK